MTESTPTGEQVRELIRQLEAGAQRTIDVMARLDDAELDIHSDHKCARGGDVWHLLTHNIEHEKLHAGQVTGTRDTIRRLQQERRTRLMAEWYVARANLIASLFGLSDPDLDKAPAEGEWSVREVVEHVLTADEGSMSALLAEHDSR